MKFVELTESDQTLYKCDNCKGTFTAVEVKLVDPADNVTILTPGYGIICIEKDGNICGKMNPRKEDGDKILSCPKCDQIHLNGFNKK